MSWQVVLGLAGGRYSKFPTAGSLAMFGHVGTFTSIAVTWKTMEN